jgi:hypothetical protein
MRNKMKKRRRKGRGVDSTELWQEVYEVDGRLKGAI